MSNSDTLMIWSELLQKLAHWRGRQLGLLSHTFTTGDLASAAAIDILESAHRKGMMTEDLLCGYILTLKRSFLEVVIKNAALEHRRRAHCEKRNHGQRPEPLEDEFLPATRESLEIWACVEEFSRVCAERSPLTLRVLTLKLAEYTTSEVRWILNSDDVESIWQELRRDLRQRLALRRWSSEMATREILGELE